MIEIDQAVDAVAEYVRRSSRYFPSTELRLEEFDYNPSEDLWYITMSIEDPVNFGRIYKTFSVDELGKVGSMRIRNPAEREEA